MKNLKYFITPLLVLTLTLMACEKDDICSETTETTPSLHIAFYDINFPSIDTPKNVTKLRVTGIGNPDPGILDGYDANTTNEAYLPLKTTENTTQYVLHRNYRLDDNGDVLGNPDTITISYVRKEIYVSRACGYKTIYDNVVITVEDDGDKWIQLVKAENDNQTVENEADIHYKLYH